MGRPTRVQDRAHDDVASTRNRGARHRPRRFVGAGVGLLVALALGAGSGCSPAAEPDETPQTPRRIVLLTLDTLRFDRLDPAAQGAETMPITRAFAARGLQFENFWTASSATQPTHASLFTGLHPWEHGVPRNGTVLSEEHRTLAERLGEAGFTTAAVISSFPLEPRFGYAQGFDVFVHDFEQVLAQAWEQKWEVDGGRFYQLDDAVTTRALELLDEAGDGDQFLWFHYFDPHEPYGDTLTRPIHLDAAARARKRGDEAYERVLEILRRNYDTDVARLDASLGRLFERLDRDAERFETHVVITSDHGESFGEHGALGHGWRVTREQVQGPLAIVSPKVAPGIRGEAAGTVDLAATVLSLAGLADPALPGRDLTAEPGDTPTRAVGMSGVPSHSLDPTSDTRQERFFAVHGDTLYAGTGSHVIEEDVPERPVADPTIAAPLRALFARFAASLAEESVVEQMDAETQEALRALGYLE